MIKPAPISTLAGQEMLKILVLEHEGGEDVRDTYHMYARLQTYEGGVWYKEGQSRPLSNQGDIF